jgi:hypothetical protein
VSDAGFAGYSSAARYDFPLSPPARAQALLPQTFRCKRIELRKYRILPVPRIRSNLSLDAGKQTKVDVLLTILAPLLTLK